MSLLVIEGLSARHAGIDDGEPVLDALTLSVGDGETFGLVGPSGCGKSTLLRVLAGIHGRWSGRICLLGNELVAGRRFEGSLRKHVQMVFQDPYGSLHPRHTIERTLTEPLRVNAAPDPRGEALRALDEVGLARQLMARYPHQLSGGQRQRVAIARALLLRPKLLLLDEPTSALDMSVQAEVLNLLNDLKSAHGMTLVLVSHDMDVIAHMCDRAAVMRGGRIVRLIGRRELAESSEAGTKRINE